MVVPSMLRRRDFRRFRCCVQAKDDPRADRLKSGVDRYGTCQSSISRLGT